MMKQLPPEPLRGFPPLSNRCAIRMRLARGQRQGSRARAAPPRRERPPSRIAQRFERGGKAPKATQGGVSAFTGLTLYATHVRTAPKRKLV